MMFPKFVRRTLVPLAALALLLFATYTRADLYLSQVTGLSPRASLITFAVLGWFIGAMSAIRLMDALVWGRMWRKKRRSPPRLLIQLTGLAIYIVTAVSIATNVFGFSLTLSLIHI